MTIREPITGQEKRGTLTEPAEALAQFYRAFNSRDLALMEENWDPSEEAVMANPLGGIKRGWAEIREVYRRIFEGPAKVRVEFHDYTLTVADDVFWAVGRERGASETESGTLELAIRTSRVFRRMNGRWRQIHHHGSFEQAELLDAYQRSIR
jgi:ketosteroid isomerase-like protein